MAARRIGQTLLAMARGDTRVRLSIWRVATVAGSKRPYLGIVRVMRAVLRIWTVAFVGLRITMWRKAAIEAGLHRAQQRVGSLRARKHGPGTRLEAARAAMGLAEEKKWALHSQLSQSKITGSKAVSLGHQLTEAEQVCAQAIEAAVRASKAILPEVALHMLRGATGDTISPHFFAMKAGYISDGIVQRAEQRSLQAVRAAWAGEVEHGQTPALASILKLDHAPNATCVPGILYFLSHS